MFFLLLILFVGLLTREIISDFFEYSHQISVLDLGRSFGEKSHSELACLVSYPDQEVLISICRLLFSASLLFQKLEFLDLTFMPIDDDLLRYIIQLPNLKGLGLGGTRVTCKGIRYLSKHAHFKSSLEILILSGNNIIDDESLKYMTAFPNLRTLELTRTEVSLNGILSSLVRYEESVNSYSVSLTNCFLTSLRLPEKAFRSLAERHGLRGDNFSLTNTSDMLNPLNTTEISYSDCQKILKYFQDHEAYPDIYLDRMLSLEDLQRKVKDLRVTRLKEERLWSIV